jgi:hypothetical protein
MQTTMKRYLIFLASGIFIALSLLGLGGCYSLSGINIDPNIRSYYVAQFQNNADNSPPNLAQDFTEAFKEKIRTQSRLIYTEEDPQIEFKGSIVDFRITSEAPQAGEQTALNRLTIVTAVEYINTLDEKKGWKKNYQFFFDFPSNVDFSSVEDEATRSIFDQILEFAFNDAFNDW